VKIEQIYLKDLLEAFESAKGSMTNIQELNDKGFNCQEEIFIFHLRILADQKFVEGEKGVGLGYSIGANSNVSWSVVPLRLTAEGHEFIEALQNREVWNTIKSDFKDASISTLWDVSKELLEGYTKKKIEALINS